MFFDWREELVTGIDEIDAEHRELFKRAGILQSACMAAKGQEELARHLWYLKRYVRKHFGDEEKLQTRYSFPAYPEHKAQHDWFRNELRRIEEQYAREGTSTGLVIKVNHLMFHWFRDHILRFDRELAAFLRQAAPPRGTGNEPAT